MSGKHVSSYKVAHGWSTAFSQRCDVLPKIEPNMRPAPKEGMDPEKWKIELVMNVSLKKVWLLSADQ